MHVQYIYIVRTCIITSTLLAVTTPTSTNYTVATGMDEMPSLSLPSGFLGRRGGRGTSRVHYSSLVQEAEILDEVPLLSEGEEEEEEEGEEGEEGEEVAWRASRRKWQRRLRSQSSFVAWLFDGGWQLLLKK